MVVAIRIAAKLAYLAVALWLAGCLVMYGIMTRTPEAISRTASHVPGWLMMGILPFQSLWTVARRGDVAVGDAAPDFDLPLQDGSGRVRLSSHVGERPVLLVFGSYT
ncbi:MAG: hypothetical protein R2729_22925 [Bryobacteraceae bacterium]